MKSLTPIVLIVISIGLFYLHIAPRYSQVQTLRSQQTQYKDALARVDDLKVSRDQLLTKYNSFSQDNLTRLERFLPDKVNTVKLIADIDNVAGRYGIAIRSVTTVDQDVDNSQTIATGENTEKPYKTTQGTFRFTSSYPNLVLFLKDLEKSLQMVDVKSVSFQVVQGSSQANSGLSEYQIAIHTYSLK